MYEKILNYIFNSLPMYHRIGSAAYKEGFENIETLVELSGYPEKKFKTIHVAGSNGKGSVSHLLASYFQELGYKTGLFTSPHLVDFRERIKVNGENISEKSVIAFFQQYQPHFDSIQPSFFEMTVALAFDHFANEKVEIAVIETGLGGRLDSTNIINPEISVITNISLEHTHMLGNSLDKIAAEKAGIIKPNIPVVVGEFNTETFPVFSAIAREKNAPLYLAEERYKVVDYGMNHLCRMLSIQEKGKTIYKNIKSPLAGMYQLKNIATFMQAIEVMHQKLNIPKDVVQQSIEHVLTNTGLLGRWQIIQEKPLIICDTGHNAAGLEEICRQLAETGYEHLHFVIGIVNDKDIRQILPVLPREATYYVCQPEIERAMEAKDLKAEMDNYGLTTLLGSSVYDTFLMAKSNTGQNDCLFIGGSTFVVGDFLKAK